MKHCFRNPLVPCDAITIPLINLLPWKESHSVHPRTIWSLNRHCSLSLEYCLIKSIFRRDMSMWTMQAQAMEGMILNAYWMTLLMGFGDILNGCDLIQMISNISLSWHGWWSSFDDSPQSLLINGRYLIDGCYLPRLILSGLVNIWYLPGMEVTPAFRSPRPSLTSHLTSRWNHLGHLLYVLHSKCWWSSFITEFKSGALPIETPSLFVAKEQTLRPQGSSQVPTSLHFPSHLHLWVIWLT